MRTRIGLGCVLTIGMIASVSLRAASAEGLRAGAFAADVTPTKFPVLVNGGFLQAKADKALTPLHAKAIVLDDGSTRIAFVVVDSCMVPRELLDKAKELAKAKTGLPTDRMLISATHTHTAPAAMGALGCPADPGYVEFLPARIAEAIEKAIARLEPARVGWAAVEARDYTHTRRWIRKPNKLVVDPFGQPTARANMHPGHLNPDVIHPSGPSDPGLTVLSVQSAAGKPLAVLANFSMHYFGTTPVSADYYGRFGEALRQLVGGDNDFVGAMSQGTSGDQQWMDYANAKTNLTLDVFADALAGKAWEACNKAKYMESARLVMEQTTLKLRRRTPDEARLAWARRIVASMGDRVPQSLPEVYAKEAIYLHEEPERELILQSIRVGDLAINAIPNEVYALTGLKLKARSPFPTTMNIELANGAEGYIPPPEQHRLGGYTTWPARTAALEVEAEPKIVKTLVGMMAKLGSPATPRVAPPRLEIKLRDVGAGDRAFHFYNLEEMEGDHAADLGPEPLPGRFEGNVAYYLDASFPPFQDLPVEANHAVYLAGGRLLVPAPKRDGWRLQLAFWSGLNPDERPVTGVLLSADNGDRLEIGGTSGNAGKLVFRSAGGKEVVGAAKLAPKTWYHLLIVRGEKEVEWQISGQVDGARSAADVVKPATEFAIGGSSDLGTRFEGMIDMVGVSGLDSARAPK